MEDKEIKNIVLRISKEKQYRPKQNDENSLYIDNDFFSQFNIACFIDDQTNEKEVHVRCWPGAVKGQLTDFFKNKSENMPKWVKLNGTSSKIENIDVSISSGWFLRFYNRTNDDYKKPIEYGQWHLKDVDKRDEFFTKENFHEWACSYENKPDELDKLCDFLMQYQACWWTDKEVDQNLAEFNSRHDLSEADIKEIFKILKYNHIERLCVTMTSYIYLKFKQDDIKNKSEEENARLFITAMDKMIEVVDNNLTSLG